MLWLQGLTPKCARYLEISSHSRNLQRTALKKYKSGLMPDFNYKKTKTIEFSINPILPGENSVWLCYGLRIQLIEKEKRNLCLPNLKI